MEWKELFVERLKEFLKHIKGVKNYNNVLNNFKR